MASEINAGTAHVKIQAKDDTRKGLRGVASGLLNDAKNIFGEINSQISQMVGVGVKMIGPLAGVASVGGLGAAALKVDKNLQENSPGYESPIKALMDSAKAAFEELGYATLPLVNMLANSLRPTIDQITATVASYTPVFVEGMATLLSSLQDVYYGALKASEGIAELTKSLWKSIGPALSEYGGRLKDEFTGLYKGAKGIFGQGVNDAINMAGRFTALGPLLTATDTKYLDAAADYRDQFKELYVKPFQRAREEGDERRKRGENDDWGQALRDQLAKIMNARANLQGAEAVKSVNAPTALERFSAAEQDFLAQQEANDTLKTMSNEQFRMRTILEQINRKLKGEDDEEAEILEVPA